MRPFYIASRQFHSLSLILPLCLSHTNLQWFGDSVVAVLAGVAAQALYGLWGPITVFRVSAGALTLGFIAVAGLWGENAGHSADTAHKPASGNIAGACVHVCVCVVVCLYTCNPVCASLWKGRTVNVSPPPCSRCVLRSHL